MNALSYYTLASDGEAVLCRDTTAAGYLHNTTPACVVGVQAVGDLVLMTLFSSPLMHDGSTPAYCWETRLVGSDGFYQKLHTCAGSREQAVAMHTALAGNLTREVGQFLRERHTHDIS